MYTSTHTFCPPNLTHLFDPNWPQKFWAFGQFLSFYLGLGNFEGYGGRAIRKTFLGSIGNQKGFLLRDLAPQGWVYIK